MTAPLLTPQWLFCLSTKWVFLKPRTNIFLTTNHSCGHAHRILNCAYPTRQKEELCMHTWRGCCRLMRKFVIAVTHGIGRYCTCHSERFQLLMCRHDRMTEGCGQWLTSSLNSSRPEITIFRYFQPKSQCHEPSSCVFLPWLLIIAFPCHWTPSQPWDLGKPSRRYWTWRRADENLEIHFMAGQLAFLAVRLKNSSGVRKGVPPLWSYGWSTNPP